MVQGHLELGSTDHFKGTEPVQLWVRPEPRWPTSYYRSATLPPKAPQFVGEPFLWDNAIVQRVAQLKSIMQPL